MNTPRVCILGGVAALGVVSGGEGGTKVGDTWLERWPDGRIFKGRVVAGSN